MIHGMILLVLHVSDLTESIYRLGVQIIECLIYVKAKVLIKLRMNYNPESSHF